MRAEANVRWCRLWKDFPAARASGEPLAAWLPWALGCEAKSALSWDDPLPLFRAAFHRLVGRHLGPAQMGTWRGSHRT
jgi:D-aspartate ligase